MNTFVGNDVTITGINTSVYSEFANAKLNKEFVFVDPQGSSLTPVKGNSGKTYEITVGDGGKTLYANIQGTTIKQPIVKIDERIVNGAQTAVLVYQGLDNERDYPYARDILNYASHSQLQDKETFTAQLQVKAENCAWVPFELTNDKFFVKFLRPITINDPHETNFVDATTGGAIEDVKLTFIDWRDHNFDTYWGTHNYYEYYNVKSITCDESQIRTDLNQSSGNFGKLLSEITNNIKFEFTAPTTSQIQNNRFFGSLKYENNGTTVGDFQIQVPLDVTYDWGTIRVNIVCKIQQTENN